MPNWVDNMLRIIKGDPKEMFEFIRSEESLFDFNNVVPMTPDVCARVSAQEDAAAIVTFTDGTSTKVFPCPPGSLRQDWNRENWGTKWNARDIAYSTKDPEHVIQFATAWDAPVPVFEALAKRFPAHEILIQSDEENRAFSTTFLLSNGQVDIVEVETA
jgi:hypothetical protein